MRLRVRIREKFPKRIKYMPLKLKIRELSTREITYAQAIREALIQSMERDSSVIIIGEGVPDPKGVFGTTLGLREKFGKDRVMDMPVSENGMTGVCLGAALCGLRPILVHQRVDFSLLSFDQIVNNIAKWHYMFGGLQKVPLVIRMIIGRGWGQGAQHSQSLQALFAHIPGLKVVMPATAYDAKGMLIEAIADNNPVIFIEHRWLHYLKSRVPQRYYTVPLGKEQIVRKGNDVTIASLSYMTVEAFKAAEILKVAGIEVEVVDIRSLRPFGGKILLESVKKTGKLLVADTGWGWGGFSSQIISYVCQHALKFLKYPPDKIALPEIPSPTSFKIAEKYYPTHKAIIKKVIHLVPISLLQKMHIQEMINQEQKLPSDIPDTSFTGPF